MKIGIYGGTFDPPHLGHMSAAQNAGKQLGFDRLYMIPTGMPPHKELADESPDRNSRLEMTEIAAEKIGAQVSDIEIKRYGKSYTIDTLNEISKENEGAELYLLMGTDMFLSIESWRSFEEIFKKAIIVVFCRGDNENEQIQKHADKISDLYGAKVTVLEHDAIEISSTDLREMLPSRKGIEFLDKGVYEYIIEHRLYNARADFSWLREKAYAMLKPRRIPHVAGCEEEAVKLAKRWGADVDEAREAAILHDITKKCDLEEQLILCEKYDIMLNTIEKNEVKLLHSKTGAAIASDLFAVSDDVKSAILWHTTGKENMSLLEKIIYLADYIEPTRDFEGLDRLRRLSYENLDEALLLGLEMSVEDMKERGIIPHNKTNDAIKWLAANKS